MEHHAYYIEGSPAEFDAYKKEVPHFVAQKYDRFGVDEARALTRLASFKNVADEAVFLIALSSITIEAQQALLKLFEEPQAGSVFVVLAPHGALIATLKSRMLPYPTSLSTSAKDSLLQSQEKTFAVTFLKSPGKERSEMIVKMLKDDEWVKERVREFLNALEIHLALRMQNAASRQGLEDVAMVRGYLSDRAPSLKMLLEHLALSLPKL